jgi:hypothetical protein
VESSASLHTFLGSLETRALPRLTMDSLPRAPSTGEATGVVLQVPHWRRGRASCLPQRSSPRRAIRPVAVCSQA